MNRIKKICLLLFFASFLTYSLGSGAKVVKVGQNMVNRGEVVRGSCWDFIDRVYVRAGYPRKLRKTIFKHPKNTGPYASQDMIQPGDWLYYLNRSYNNIEHSGIFVRWVNKAKRIAMMISYRGQNRSEPGRMAEYKLSHVYNIMRPNVYKKNGYLKSPNSVADNSLSILRMKAERKASKAGSKVLRIGRQMVAQKTIVSGTSQNYLNVLFARAGYLTNKRQVILNGQKDRGPYAQKSQIQKGDWLCFINYSYNRVAHCGVFVRWLSQAKRLGEILSYAGENRRVPGRYRDYDLSSVYHITRATERNVVSSQPKITPKSPKKLPPQVIVPRAKPVTALNHGERVLQEGRAMLKNKVMIVGSSPDYIKAVFARAGYPSSKRYTMLMGRKDIGPYASSGQIQPGDWLCFINHSYNNVEHCGIFVSWVNQSSLIGKVLSYAGENRKVLARFRNYNLAHVYKLIRAI